MITTQKKSRGYKASLAIVGPRLLGEPEWLGTTTFYPTFTNHKQVIYAFERLDSLVAALEKREQKKDPEFTAVKDLLIVSGGALGADEIGRLWAQHNQIDHFIMPAKWKLFKKAAGHIRNGEMIPLVKYCVAFWDGESKGTAGSIAVAKKNKVKLKVVMYADYVPYLSH